MKELRHNKDIDQRLFCVRRDVDIFQEYIEGLRERIKELEKLDAYHHSLVPEGASGDKCKEHISKVEAERDEWKKKAEESELLLHTVRGYRDSLKAQLEELRQAVLSKTEARKHIMRELNNMTDRYMGVQEEREEAEDALWEAHEDYGDDSCCHDVCWHVRNKRKKTVTLHDDACAPCRRTHARKYP